MAFDYRIDKLAGYSLGKEVYNSQVKDLVDFRGVVTVAFPPNIKDIAISFVQGFVEAVFESKSKESFFDILKIEGNDKVVKKFTQYVLF